MQLNAHAKYHSRFPSIAYNSPYCVVSDRHRRDLGASALNWPLDDFTHWRHPDAKIYLTPYTGPSLGPSRHLISERRTTEDIESKKYTCDTFADACAQAMKRAKVPKETIPGGHDDVVPRWATAYRKCT